MRSLCPGGISEQRGTRCHHPLSTGAPVSNPGTPCRGNHPRRNHSGAFCKSMSLQAFCLECGKLGEWLQLVKCQMEQELQQLLHHRDNREFLGLQPEVGFMSSFPPCLYGRPVLPVPFTGQCLHFQSGAHTARILSCLC